MSGFTVVIFSDNTGWHEQRLLNALTQRGAQPRVVSLRDCALRHDAPGVLQLGVAALLPDAVFVRAIPAGTFEEVSLRLDLLHALQELGVLVVNPARVIERTVDKGMTSLLLRRAAVPTPAFWVCESEIEARRIVAGETAEGRKVVLKPLFGNCGRGLKLIDAQEHLPARDAIQGVYYLQRFVPQPEPGGRDWRIFVIGGAAVAAMERVSQNWITNRARGGQCLPTVLTGELRALAEDAARAVDACYCGVDIIRTGAGRFEVLEVNGVPAWRGLQSVHNSGIADLLADDLLRRLHARHGARAAV
jgi:RimK family alpha-L-glutamate ligase